MANHQFTIPYNGDNVEVTALNDSSFLIQITYKPLLIKQKAEEGNNNWVDVETNVETFLAAELGQLISKYYMKAEATQPV